MDVDRDAGITSLALNNNFVLAPSTTKKQKMLLSSGFKYVQLITALVFPFCACGIPKTHTFLPNTKISEGWIFYWVMLNSWIHAHFSIHFKEISACSKVFVEHMICFGELEEASSSYSSSIKSTPLNPKVSPNTKKLERVCIESFRCFDTLDPRTLDLVVALIS